MTAAVFVEANDLGTDGDAALHLAAAVTNVTDLAHRACAQVQQPAVRRLFARLTPDAARLVKVAAVLGPRFSVDVLSDVMGEPVGALLPSIDEVVAAEAFIVFPTTVGFRHEAVRGALYAEIPEPMRRALHRQIGTSLLGRGGSAVAAAQHLLEGARQGDCITLDCLDRASAEALGNSPAAAADLALRALTLTEPADEHRLARGLAAVDALVRAQRLEEAAALARSVLVDPALAADARAQLRLTLSSILFGSGLPAEAVAEAEKVLAEPDLDESLYAGAEIARLFAVLAEDDLSTTRQLAESILAGEPECRGDAALAGALMVLSFLAWRQGQVADTLGLLRAAIRRADRGPVEGRRVHPHLCLAAKLTALGEFEDADESVTQGELGITVTGDTVWASAPDVFRARLRLASGRLDEAQAHAEAGLLHAEATGCRFFVPMALSVLAAVALQRGDIGDAARHLARCQAEPPSTRAVFAPTIYAWVEAQVAAVEGDSERALRALANDGEDMAGLTPLLVEEAAAAAFMVRMALAAGDRSRAQAVVACAQRLATHPGAGDTYPALYAAAEHARGLLERDPQMLLRAAATHRHPWAAASALEDAGAVLAERSDVPGATGCWERSLDAYQECEATRDASRVRARLREAGVRRRHWRHADRPVSGWGSLTEGELRVAHLVAEGLTNPRVGERMFVSRHTVDFHLRQIFRKLEISSRVELTRLVLEQEAPHAAART
jgi:DNA-binding CsgD family transcriptional regulator/tetratricopeptide (TPR) repeat protein